MTAADRSKALDNALAQIERSHGKGSVMRLGDQGRAPVEVIPSGSIALDVALGLGGLPRGRVVEIFGPESSGKTTVALHAVANAQRGGGIAAFIDAEHALDPEYAQKLGVDTDALLVSQPDSGEQALEIADMLIRSGALDIIVIDSVAALVPRAEIEGEMGDSHVGLQARLMSQALRKLTGALSNSGTTAIFINQLREKIGVMFGCLSYGTRVVLADGTTAKIGKIVNQKLPVEVLSYDPQRDAVVPRRVVNWFDNGNADRFLQFTVEKSSGNGRAQFAATQNHLIRTPGGWRQAGDLIAGDRVMASETHRLSDQQWQVVLGSLLGDGNLSPNRRDRNGVRFRLGHGAKQADYLDWKVSLLDNIECSRRVNAKGAAFADFTPLPELGELQRTVYMGDGKKTITWDYLKALTPLALAIWFMDDGCFVSRSKGLQARTQGGSGRVQFCIEAMNAGSRDRLVQYLRDTHGLNASWRAVGATQKAVLTFTTAASSAFLELVAPHVHPSMDYKLLPRLRGRFDVAPEFVEPQVRPVPARVLDVHMKPPTRSMRRFDLEVEGNHNYFADGVMVHNSPETTTGGRALKFYSSVRLDVRRIESLKDGTEFVGNRTRVKVVKNKCLAEGTRIFDPTTGLTHRIEDVVNSQLPIDVAAADKKGILHVRPVVSWFDQGEQDVIGLRIKGGAEIWVTPDHQVMTDHGWRLAGDLRIGDYVARPRRGSQRGYLPKSAIEPVLAHLRGRGVTPLLLAQLLGVEETQTKGGLLQLLGGRRLRRDRMRKLAEALDDSFLDDILAEQLTYLTVTDVLPARRARTFDVEVEELHNLVAEDILVHNCAPPFKQAEFDIMYGQGISREGGLIDVGVDAGLVRKSGAWYTYEGDQLGQGKENARAFLRDNPDLANELEKRILEKLGIGATVDEPPRPAEPTNIDF